jgi:hypothetical protein
MKRILPLFFTAVLMGGIATGCGEREVQSPEEMQTLQQEQQPMNQDQTGSEYQTQEQQ